MRKDRINKELTLQKDHYNQLKNQYDFKLIENPPLHTILETQAILNRLKFREENKYILEFGSGAGRLTIPLLKHGYRIFAVDSSTLSLATLKKRCSELRLTQLRTYGNLSFNEKFETIVGADILHHIALDTYLPLLNKKIVKHGKMIFTEPNAFHPAWYIYLPIFQNWAVEKRVIQNRYFNLKHTFIRYGFTDVKITGLGIIPRPFLNFSRKLCELNDKAGNIPGIKFFSYRFIIEATKQHDL